MLQPPAFETPEPPARTAPGPRVVIERELLRASRRWQTAGLRAGYAALLLGVIAFFWKERVLGALDWDPTALSWAGRRVFEGYTFVQTWMLVLLTPILVAQGIIEERNAGTLKLLAITRLSPTKLLVGKLASRLLTIEALVLAGLPFLALCLSLGGVEPAQVANVFLQANAMMLGLAGVACFVSLYAKGPILPAIAAWAWAFLAWLPGALPMGGWRGDEDDMAFVSPLVALFEAEGVEMVGPLVVALAVLGLCTGLSSRVFATLAGGDEGSEVLSSDVWAVERIARRIGLLTAALFVAMPFVGVVWAFATRSRTVDAWLAFPLVYAWNLLAVVAFTGGWLFGVRKALRWIGGRRERRFGWKAEIQTWDQDAAPVEVRERSLSQHKAGEGKRTRPHNPRFLRPVWDNPVAWREIVTGIHGGFSRFIGWGYAAVIGFLVLLCLIPDFVEDPEAPLGCAFMALGVAWLSTALAAASSASGEMRAKSLALLVTTRMSSARILGGKVAGVLVVAAPALLTAIALLIGGVGEFDTAYRWDWEDETWSPSELMGRWAGMSAFAVAVTTWFAVGNMALGLWAKTPGRAWILSLTHVAAWVFVPAILVLLVHPHDGLEPPLVLFNPALDEAFWTSSQLPGGVWVSAGVWFALSAAVFARTAGSLSERASR